MKTLNKRKVETEVEAVENEVSDKVVKIQQQEGAYCSREEKLASEDEKPGKRIRRIPRKLSRS